MNLNAPASSGESISRNQLPPHGFRQAIEPAETVPQVGVDVAESPRPYRVPYTHRFMASLFQPVTLLLFLTILVVTRGMSQGEFFFYNDEMRHAMTGVFFRDFLVDLPLRHPQQYAFQYYAKYPAVAVPHWPPLFHFVEGVAFLVRAFRLG